MGQGEWPSVQSALGHVLRFTLPTGPWAGIIYPSLGTAVCTLPFLVASKNTELELEPGPGWAVVTTPQLLVAVFRASSRNPSLYSHHLPALDGPAV